VVVGGSGAGGVLAWGAAFPSAKLAVGPTVSAARAPSEMRLASELAGVNRNSEARLRVCDRPRDSSHVFADRLGRDDRVADHNRRRLVAGVGARADNDVGVMGVRPRLAR